MSDGLPVSRMMVFLWFGFGAGCGQTDENDAPRDTATRSEEGFDTAETVSTEEAAGTESGSEADDSETETKPNTDTEEIGGDTEPDISVSVLEHEILLEEIVVPKSIQTVLEVAWRQQQAADAVWLRFTFEDDEWYESPKKPGTAGFHREAVLGVPEETEVLIRVMSLKGDVETVEYETTGATGSLPSIVPRATILSHAPSLASADRWMIGSVENTQTETSSYKGPFCILIIDRKGRVVWYYMDPAWNPCMAFPRIARDGSHIAIDRSERGGTNRRSVIRTTLDLAQFEEFVTPRMADGMALTDDGGILFASTEWLRELRPDGTLREIWHCPTWADETDAHSVSLDGFLGCYPNTVNWNPLNDSILLSYPEGNTVVEISRQTGEVIAQYGKVAGSWDFSPTESELECVHGANITEAGTLLVSVREPGTGFPGTPVPHYFIEFQLDPVNQVATEIWRYGEGVDDFPKWKGEAYRMPGGNTLINYGTGGIIREVTPDGRTAWHVKYDADFENDFTNKMVGHTILIDDLYALTRGW